MALRWRTDWGVPKLAAGSPVRRLVQESEYERMVACAREVAAERVIVEGCPLYFLNLRAQYCAHKMVKAH